MTTHFNIKITKTLSKTKILSKLKKINIISKIEVDLDTENSLYLKIGYNNINDVDIILDQLILNELIFDFLGISIEGLETKDSLILLEKSQQIHFRMSKLHNFAIESTLSKIISELNKQNSRITNLQIGQDTINEQLCFDILGTIIEICESIDRTDIIEGNIDLISVQ